MHACKYKLRYTEMKLISFINRIYFTFYYKNTVNRSLGRRDYYVYVMSVVGTTVQKTVPRETAT